MNELQQLICELERAHRKCVNMIKKRDSNGLRQLHKKIATDLQVCYQAHIYWYGKDFSGEV